MPSVRFRLPSRRRRLTTALLLLPLAAGCITVLPEGGGPGSAPPPLPVGPPGWQVRTREHVDLWLHGYALVQADSSTLPFFRPGYQRTLLAARDSAGVVTLLDANLDRLVAGLAANPGLVNGQFLPLYFTGWEEMREAIDAFVAAEGNVRRVDAAQRRGATILAQLYPSAADRDWLRAFARSLDDEWRRFYERYWTARRQALVPAYTAADSAVRAVAGGVLQRYLRNANLTRGDVLLALPLGGEGRSSLQGVERALVTVGFPQSAGDGRQAAFTFVHEIVAPAVDVALRDAAVVADAAAGPTAIDRYTTSGLVRGGYLVLRRAEPELAEAYARYYLRLAGREAGRDPGAALAATFPLPASVARAIEAQVEEIWQGI